MQFRLKFWSAGHVLYWSDLFFQGELHGEVKFIRVPNFSLHSCFKVGKSPHWSNYNYQVHILIHKSTGFSDPFYVPQCGFTWNLVTCTYDRSKKDIPVYISWYMWFHTRCYAFTLILNAVHQPWTFTAISSGQSYVLFFPNKKQWISIHESIWMTFE
jgi:hypothetical protein